MIAKMCGGGRFGAVGVWWAERRWNWDGLGLRVDDRGRRILFRGSMLFRYFPVTKRRWGWLAMSEGNVERWGTSNETCEELKMAAANAFVLEIIDLVET